MSGEAFGARRPAPTTAEYVLQTHPHAFAVIILERPATEHYTTDMVVSNDVSNEFVARAVAGIAHGLFDMFPEARQPLDSGSER